MKIILLTSLIFAVLTFSLGEKWEGLEDVINVQQDVAIEVVDQLDMTLNNNFTDQIENQTQQLMKDYDKNKDIQEINDHNNQSNQNDELKDDQEIHTVDYWLEKLGDEFSDSSILLQGKQIENKNSLSDQITEVIGNLILVGDENGPLQEIANINKQEQLIIESKQQQNLEKDSQKNQYLKDPLIIEGIELEFSNSVQPDNQIPQIEDLLTQAQKMKEQLQQQNQNEQIKEKKHKKQQQIIDINFEDINEDEINISSQQIINNDNIIQNNNQNVNNSNQEQQFEINQVDEQIDQQNNNQINEQILDLQSYNQEENKQIEQQDKLEKNDQVIQETQSNEKLYNFLNHSNDQNLEKSQQSLQNSKQSSYKPYTFSNENKQQQTEIETNQKENNELNYYQQDNQINKKQMQINNDNLTTKTDEVKNNMNEPIMEKDEDQEQPSLLKKYLLYTVQPDVIITESNEKIMEEDKKLLIKFKTISKENSNQEQLNDQSNNQSKNNNKISSDFKNELFKTYTKFEEPQSTIKEDPPKIQKTQIEHQNQQDIVENPHKFISFKKDPSIDIPIQTQQEKSKYDDLPQTKLQTKEEMKLEKQKKIKEMEIKISEELKNKKIEKKNESNESRVIGYEKDYILWEMSTQPKTFQQDVNLFMIQSNLRRRKL